MADIDGLWTAEGVTTDGWPTSGVLICVRNRVLGGGDRYYCDGLYRLHGHIIEIDAHIHHYHGATQSALASTMPDFTVHYRGRFLAAAGIIEGTVHRADNPYRKLPVKLIQRAPLSL